MDNNNNNQMQQLTGVQKVMQIVIILFNIICLYYGMYKIFNKIGTFLFENVFRKVFLEEDNDIEEEVEDEVE